MKSIKHEILHSLLKIRAKKSLIHHYIYYYNWFISRRGENVRVTDGKKYYYNMYAAFYGNCSNIFFSLDPSADNIKFQFRNNGKNNFFVLKENTDYIKTLLRKNGKNQNEKRI